MAATPALPVLPREGHSRPGTVGRGAPAAAAPPGASAAPGAERRASQGNNQDSWPVADQLKAIWEKGSGSSLRAWLKHFDKNYDHRISKHEFREGMKEIDYRGDADALFALLDTDKSGELTLEEVDSAQAVLWRSFRTWCADTFMNVEDMFMQLGGREAARSGKILRAQFVDGLSRAGWTLGWEDLLFHSFSLLHHQNQHCITAETMQWLEVEHRRLRRKELARQRSLQARRRMAAHVKKAPGTLVQEFKQYLKRRFGGFVRAWRCGLSPDGSMVLHRTSFFKACVRIGWISDTKQLWEAFDKDDSGFISVDELDLRSSEVLARFCTFVRETFGSASAAFRALDRYKTQRMRQPVFEESLRAYGYTHSLKMLFHGLDWNGKKTIIEEDLLFLDRWKPMPFLLAVPSEQGKEDVKARLLEHFRSYLKAWRRALDKDSSNRCNWFEFEQACRDIGFVGNVPGAWRALDMDFSGYITLREIDPASSSILYNFKKWADQEFGGVASLFGVFDHDGSNEITYHEFRRSCRIYGFEGNAHAVFWALDAERSGTVSAPEMGFLDKWEFPEDSLPPEERLPESGSVEEASLGQGPPRHEPPTPAKASKQLGPTHEPLARRFSATDDSRTERRRSAQLWFRPSEFNKVPLSGRQLPPLQLPAQSEEALHSHAADAAEHLWEASAASSQRRRTEALGGLAAPSPAWGLSEPAAERPNLASTESLLSLWSRESLQDEWGARTTKPLGREASEQGSPVSSARGWGRGRGRGGAGGRMPTLDELLRGPRLQSARRGRPPRPWPRSPCAEVTDRVAWPLSAR